MGQPSGPNRDSTRQRLKRMLSRLPLVRGFVARKRAVEAECARLASALAAVEVQRDALLADFKKLQTAQEGQMAAAHAAHVARIEELRAAAAALAAERNALAETVRHLRLA